MVWGQRRLNLGGMFLWRGGWCLPPAHVLYTYPIHMVSSRFPLWQPLLLVLFMHLIVASNANAAFGGFVPLAFSGQLTYAYNYATNGANESETTSLIGGLNAAGYVWRPWFATTSLALNLAVSNTETSTSSFDSTSSTGNLTLGVFPRSRFPFSLTYSRSDSQSESYYDLTQISGEVRTKVTRLSLRQSYRPRRSKQVYNGWFYETKFDGQNFTSENSAYGLIYQMRLPRQNVMVTTTHSESQTLGSDVKPKTDLISVTHVYTPNPEIGLNSLGSYIESETGSNNVVSSNSQLASSFSWRPEHRSLNVSGGVRMSESKAEGGASEGTLTRGLSTNLGLNYRVTRAFNVNASASVSASDNDSSRTLSTSQILGMSYTGSQHQIAGFGYSWSGNASVSNAATQSDIAGEETKSDTQSAGAGLGHGINKNWSIGNNASMVMGISQSGSVSKNTSVDVVAKTISHSTNLSWNRRGRSGSTHANTRFSDSRSFGATESVFQQFGFNLAQDLAINRLSRLNGNMSYQASRGETKNSLDEVAMNGSRLVNGSMSYAHERPFSVYNLRFTSRLTGTKQINSDTPATTVKWDGIFRYRLGLLNTSLSFRAIKSASGTVSKSMAFRATRSF